MILWGSVNGTLTSRYRALPNCFCFSPPYDVLCSREGNPIVGARFKEELSFNKENVIFLNLLVVMSLTAVNI